MLHLFPFFCENNGRAEVFHLRKFGTWHKLLFISLYLKLACHAQKFYKQSLKFLKTTFALIGRINVTSHFT